MPTEPANLVTSNRHIRVFISSTFRDMQEERDVLIKRIFPQLRKLCEERAVTWTEVDLRWGITDEQKAEGRVLPLCLEEIHRCRPYFIGLLGERYGWVPEPNSVPLELLESQPWLRQHLQHSVTELEILHGVFSQEGMHGHAHFYFRDPRYSESVSADKRESFIAESPESVERLRKLKQKIRGANDEQVCKLRENYANPEQLGEWILEDFTKLIDDVYPKDQTPDLLDQEAARHEAYARSRRLAFIGREDLLGRLNEHAVAPGKPLVLTGESGCGKSALLAEWVARWRRDYPDDLIIQHYIGSTPDSADWQGLVRRILDELKRAFAIIDEVPLQANALRTALGDWMVKAAGSRRVVLVLDALNQLSEERAARQLGWLPVVFPTTFRVLVSSLPGESLDVLCKRGWPELNVPPFAPAEIAPAALAYFKLFSKTPPKDIVAKLESTPAACNALYLRAVLDELRQFGIYEKLQAKAADYLSAGDSKELYGRILGRWEEDFGVELVQRCLSVIWAARRGLSEAELAGLLGTDGEKMPRAQWSPLFLAVSEALVSQGGLWGFAHESLRTAVHGAYLSTELHRQQARTCIADYFEQRTFQGVRHTNEIVWQLAESQQWDRLYSKLADLGFLYVLFASSPTDVMRFWAQLEAHSKYRAAAAYRELLASPSQYEPIVVQLVASLMVFGQPAESIPLFEHLASHHKQAGKRGELQACLWSHAMLLHRQGELGAALALLKEHDQMCVDVNSRRDLAASLGLQGQILRDKGEFDAAMSVLNQQESICREIKDDYLLGLSLGTQGTILQARGELDAAMLCHKEHEALCRRLGIPELHVALGNQAVIHYSRGELDSAMKLFRQEGELCREVGDTTGLASSSGGQAMVYQAWGENEKALSHYKEEERLFREIGHKRGLANSLGNQATIPLELGKFELASSLLAEQERICREIGDKVGLVASLTNQAKLAGKCGDVAKQIEFIYEKGGLLAELGDGKGMVEAVSEMAGILHRSGELEKALAMHKHAEQLCRQLGNFDVLQHSLRNQGLILLSLSQLEDALRLQQQAEAVCRQTNNIEGLGLSLGNQALVLTQKGQRHEALVLAEKARELGVQHNLPSLIKQVDLLLGLLRSHA